MRLCVVMKMHGTLYRCVDNPASLSLSRDHYFLPLSFFNIIRHSVAVLTASLAIVFVGSLVSSSIQCVQPVKCVRKLFGDLSSCRCVICAGNRSFAFLQCARSSCFSGMVLVTIADLYSGWRSVDWCHQSIYRP